MGERETAEREFVMLDGFDKYNDDELVAVQERLEIESTAVLAELAAENQRRSEAAIAAARARAERAGVTVRVDSGESMGGKRGRKTKAQKAAEEAAALANGQTDDPDVLSLDAE